MYVILRWQILPAPLEFKTFVWIRFAADPVSNNPTIGRICGKSSVMDTETW